MNSTVLINESGVDTSGKITAIACEIYRKYSSEITEEMIRFNLVSNDVFFSIPGPDFIRENIPGTSVACYLTDDYSLLIFRRQSLTRFSLEKLKKNIRNKSIRDILIVVYRDWGVTISKVVLRR